MFKFFSWSLESISVTVQPRPVFFKSLMEKSCNMQDSWIPHAVSDTDLKLATNAAYEMSRKAGSLRSTFSVLQQTLGTAVPLLSPSSNHIVPQAALSAERTT